MVSIVIPTYNRANVIKRSIESVLSQSYQDFEIIVVDDASTDNTRLLVEEIGDSRIRYLKNDRRMGANGARNIGIQNAGGEYIAFQDSDDVWRGDKLDKQMNMFQDRADVDVIYSRYVRHMADGKSMLVPDEKYTKGMLQEGIAHTLAKSNVIGTPTMIARRKCFYECGMFDLELERFQDWEINIAFVKYYKYGFIDEALVDAYLQSDSITNVHAMPMSSIAYIVKKHKEFFEAQDTLAMHLLSLANQSLEQKRLEDLQRLLGEALFARSIYLHCENVMKRLDIIRKNYNFIKEWMYREGNSQVINSFLSGYPDDSVAIYGLGDIGKLFLNALTEENKRKVRYVIDRKKLSVAEHRVLSLEMLDSDELEGIEDIIITAVSHEDEIRSELEKLAAVSVISVYDIITDAAT